MEMKKCPICGEEIPAKALRCKYCREWLVSPEENLENNQENPATEPQPTCQTPAAPQQSYPAPPNQQNLQGQEPESDEDDDYDDDDEDVNNNGIKNFFSNLSNASRKTLLISITTVVIIIILVFGFIFFKDDISSFGKKSKRHKANIEKYLDDYEDEEEEYDDEDDSDYVYLEDEYVGTGYINGKYPITMELSIDSDNRITGKYAYESTLRRNGDVPSSWISLVGTISEGEMIIRYRNVPDNVNHDEMYLTLTVDDNGLQLDGKIKLIPPKGPSEIMPMSVTLQPL